MCEFHLYWGAFGIRCNWAICTTSKMGRLKLLRTCAKRVFIDLCGAVHVLSPARPLSLLSDPDWGSRAGGERRGEYFSRRTPRDPFLCTEGRLFFPFSFSLSYIFILCRPVEHVHSSSRSRGAAAARRACMHTLALLYLSVAMIACLFIPADPTKQEHGSIYGCQGRRSV